MLISSLTALLLATAAMQDMPETAPSTPAETAPAETAPAETAPAQTAPAQTGTEAGQTGQPRLQLDPAPEQDEDMVRHSAGEYAAYHSVVADLRNAPIQSGDDLDQAMDRLSAFYGEDRLVRAWIAYAAIIAAHHPDYIDQVRELADYYGPEAALSGLMNDPAFATSFSAAPDAQDSVIDAIGRDNDEIRAVSERYRSAAYSLQSERWANRVYRDRADRLAAISGVGDSPITLSEELRMSLDTGLGQAMPASALFEPLDLDTALPLDDALSPQLSLTVGEAVPDPDRTRIGRILSVAALQSLDGSAADTDAAIDTLLSDPIVERCLAWVRLDLSQCVAAGHFKYEDSFCIAEHALLDVSRCLDTADTAD